MTNQFGLFIHWGVYSAFAWHEQALARLQIPFDEYDAQAAAFNPKGLDVEKWVLLAKNAGMKYICFTAKHHDGFCLWDTKYTDYNIVNTPYGKDVLKDLAAACKKHGVALSIYYSNPDWRHEKAYNPLSSHQWAARNNEETDLTEYRQFIKNQITELLTGYGEIYTLFWDIPPQIEDASLNELARQLQPNILINDRGWSKGDFSTPERELPLGERFDKPTEACQSVGEQSWGYREEEDYYSVRFLLSSIDKIMAMGGSYLLNVGPKMNGEIPLQAKATIEYIGSWYNRMGGVLENNVPTKYPLKLSAEGIVNDKDGKTYLHFFNGLHSRAVHLYEGAPCIPKKAKLLNDGRELRIRFQKLPYRQEKTGVCEKEYISICDIPCDEFPLEPLVIELTWE